MRKQPRTRSRLVTPSASGAGSARASDRRSRDSWGSLSLPKVDCSFRFYGCAPRENSDSVYVACPGGRTHIDEIQVSPDGVQLTPIQGPPLRGGHAGVDGAGASRHGARLFRGATGTVAGDNDSGSDDHDPCSCHNPGSCHNPCNNYNCRTVRISPGPVSSWSKREDWWRVVTQGPQGGQDS